MSEEFEAADPFSIKSPVVFDVPPQTAKSNVITEDKEKEYAIRPDKQIFLNAYLGYGTVPFTYHNKKNFAITKIYYCYHLETVGSFGCMLRIYQADSTTGDSTYNIHLGFLNVNPNDTIPFLEDLRQIDFIKPLIFETANDRFFLQIDLLGEKNYDTVDVYVLGYELD